MGIEKEVQEGFPKLESFFLYTRKEKVIVKYQEIMEQADLLRNPLLSNKELPVQVIKKWEFWKVFPSEIQ